MITLARSGLVRFGTMLGALSSLAFAGCAAAPRRGDPYLDDVGYRRAELQASLVQPRNGYSQLRLDHYATGTSSDWDQLPEWNPAVEPILESDIGPGASAGSGPVSDAAHALALPETAQASDEETLLALGKQAFERYPTQLAPYLALALGSATATARYGLWLDAARGVGGLVRARMADGGAQLALTCSSCHAARTDGGIENGLPNAELDLGAAMVEAAHGALDPAQVVRFAAWGAGRLDVSTTTGGEPARIADLRPVRFQQNLQQDATLRMRDRSTLAIRIETLLITASGQTLRPPRVVALALAAYVLSLGDALPSPSVAERASTRGAALFTERCASCHIPPAFSGPAVALSVIGTDPTLGSSQDRGTGAYRVPSLRGVGTRGPLLHDGTLPSLDALLDPARTSEGFAGALHAAQVVPGHPFGLDLDDDDRSALLAYLRAL